MEISEIKNMTRKHLEDLVEYLIRQQETSVNVAPNQYERPQATAWVRGFDYSRKVLIEMAEDYEKLKNHLP